MKICLLNLPAKEVAFRYGDVLADFLEYVLSVNPSGRNPNVGATAPGRPSFARCPDTGDRQKETGDRGGRPYERRANFEVFLKQSYSHIIF
ncbi:hypothetical protein FACS1894187_15060 [Synergistales bacterium]|nr:hypothetical protein FACS1894187_15060 [Synergistales bacterium]